MKSKHIVAGLAGMIATTLLITGCGSGDDDGGAAAPSIVGDWTWTKLTLSGVTLNIEDIGSSTAGGTTVLTPQTPGLNATATASFGADKSMVVDVTASSGPKSVSGTWATSGDELTVALTVPILPIPAISVKAKYAVTANSLTLTVTSTQVKKVINDATAGLGIQSLALLAGVTLPAEINAILNGLTITAELTR